MQDIVSVISRSRLDSYDGNTDEEKLNNYYENRCLAIKASHKCGEIEIYLRNKFVSCFPTPDDCFNLVQTIIASNNLDVIGNKLKNKTIDQFISSLTFGELIVLIDHCKLKGRMFNLINMIFKKYNQNNRSYLWVRVNNKNTKRTTLNNLDKNIIALELIRVIRNRAAHWKNLMKIEIDQNGKLKPTITTKHRGENYFGILPEYILDFLDDLIISIGVNDMEKYKDIEDLL